jgi:NDP-sugar pyrophosphorylase family protein
MNQITKTPIADLGYNFIDSSYIPKGKDEYYLRYIQNPDHDRFRHLTAKEIKQLVANGNISDNWKNVLVTNGFDCSLVQQCRFYGLIRIGKLEPFYLEFHDIRLPVGLYNSSIISCDLGDNVVINNVNYLSHYIIGNEVIIVNVNEIEVSNHAKFGNGIIKKGEKESVRIWLELCNENAGRSVMPFDGMQAGDAWLWTRYRGDEVLMEKFKEFTEKKFDNRRGYYGMIGDRTVIKNSRIIKDTNIGSDAYIKGANKLKNLTINSSAESPTQIGEGCELVNGILGFGCKAFYGAKAVRFILASHSQLKYGARLINSFLGDNSTISCCEVLNSLIFPAHEQHHNNSFLCASVLKGQSNMAAGATIGSNHNSRGADGEIIAGRGFWPGLCVSLKHNSKFASYTLIAKGDFPAELNIRIPFSLVSNVVSEDKLVIMPGYWFMYNMYALARNSGKYESRDKRTFKNQLLEYDFLAPDSVNEMFDALQLMKQAVGESQQKKSGKKISEEQILKLGSTLLEQNINLDEEEILITGLENTTRKVQLIKVTEAYRLFKELIVYYGITQLLSFIEKENIDSFDKLVKSMGKPNRSEWTNIGGQLIPKQAMDTLITDIHSGKINSWDDVHAFYKETSEQYHTDKRQHAFASMLELLQLTLDTFSENIFLQLLQQSIATKEWMVNGIYESRAKDYASPFRQMVYETEKEMEKVIGKLKENAFIQQQQEELTEYKKRVAVLIKNFNLQRKPASIKN